MDTNKKGKSILDILDNIELELLQNDPDYAKQFLQDEGFDIEEELKFSNQYIKKVRFMAKGLSNKDRDLSLLDKAFERIKEVIKDNSEKASETLINMLQTKTPSVQYRKLEKWTDDEIRDVLADVDLVKLLEDLKKEE
jgi:hypothetical protein